MMKKKKKQKAQAVKHRKVQKIRLGYLSADLGQGRLRELLPMFFMAYDAFRYEIYAYHTEMGGDSSRFAEKATVREIGTCTPEEAAELIRRDHLDLLVDLSLDAVSAHHAAVMRKRPAEHIVSLAEHVPEGLAVRLPTVEGQEVFPYCYTQIEQNVAYTYRAPLLDTGIPTIGVCGSMTPSESSHFLELLSYLLPAIGDVHLVLPASIAGGLSAEDIEQIAACGSAGSSLDFVDDLSYDTLDVMLGLSVDLVDVCHAAEHGIPLITVEHLVRDRYAKKLLCQLELPPRGDVQGASAACLAMCADRERLSACHGLLRWRLIDFYDAGMLQFALERAYERALAQGDGRSVAALTDELSRAASRQDWDAVLTAAHQLDGHDALSAEQRMSLAWGYHFGGAAPLAARWAMSAQGLPTDREGARLYLSISGIVPGTENGVFERVRHGLKRVEEGLSVVPEVRAALLKGYADHAPADSDAELASQCAIAYAREAADPFLQRVYYGAGLLKLNAADVSAQEVYEKSLGYGALFADVRPYTHQGRRKKDKIRIGYISGDFRQHVMQYFVWPFLAGYDADTFEVYVYSLGKSDQYTDFFKTLVTRWRDLSAHERDMERIAREIHADEVDILFDLAGHTAGTGLAALAWKPAPVQLSGLGYMATTGLRSVDYFVTDHCCDPEGSGSEVFYVEKLLRLTSQFCYNGYTHLPRSTGTPARGRGYIQFASFNQYQKIRDPMLRAWQKIMERVPQARLLLKNNAYSKPGVVQSAYARLQRLGFDMSRVMFEEATRDYMLRYFDVDIALDTYPWPGGGTTCDALYMGVPVVSYYTERHSTRFTYSILANIGLSDLASTSLSDYVETSVALAGNLDLLDALHRELRDRMKASPVMDQERYIREMEECYRAIWNAWESENTSL
nr:hypothetical protein [uncultured Selenomonas sp.]